MLIPFLGTLILFNQYVIDVLAMSPEVSTRWLGGNDHGASTSQVLTVNRLVTTYFGLVLLGGASFFFTLACPREVKAYGSAQSYIETERPFVTSARTALLVTAVANDYLVNTGEEEAIRWWPPLKKIAYPSELELLFEGVTRQISDRSIEGVEDVDIHSGNGNIHAEKVARILRAQIRALRVVWGRSTLRLRNTA